MKTKDKATLGRIMSAAGTWISVNEVAKMFKVHPDTIRRWADKGLIQSVRHPVNNYRLFLVEELDGEETEK